MNFPLSKFTLSLIAILVLAGGIVVWGVQGGTTVDVTLNTNPDLQSGLVGHWTFDGDLNTKITDRSSQGNHGYLTANAVATSSLTAPGKIGQGLHFTSATDQMKAIKYDLTTGYTYSAWVKGDRAPTVGETFGTNFLQNDNRDVSGINWDGFSDTDTVRAYHRNSANGYQYAQITSSSTIAANTWYHFTASWDQTNLRVYFNGKLEATTLANAGSASPAAGTFNVGVDGSPGFVGSVDDVRVYNRALSGEEIKRLYELGATTHVNTTLNTNPDLKSGLVGHWTFDGKDIVASTTANAVDAMDRSGQRNNGTLTGFGDNTSTTTSGKIGQALSFDGVDDYVRAGTAYSIVNNFTVSVWMKRTANFSAADFRMMFSNGADGANGWAIYLKESSGSHLHSFLKGGAFAENSTIVNPLNKWEHVLYTVSGSRARLYINGVLAFTFTDSTAIVAPTPYKFIGADQNASGDPQQYFPGLLDDVRVYNRALSTEEIKRLYDLGATTHINTTLTTNPDLKSGLVGHWTFDGKDIVASTTANAVDATDRSGSANNGTLTGFGNNTSTTTPGKIGQALSFDGVNDYVNGTMANVPMGNTMSVWFKANVLGTYKTFLAHDTGANDGQRLGISNSDALNFTLGSVLEYACTGFTFQTNTWYFFAVTNTGNSGTMTCYLGTQGGTLQKTAPIAIGTRGGTPNQFWIGRGGGGSDQHNGAIDDVRFYNRALSDEETARIYNLGR